MPAAVDQQQNSLAALPMWASMTNRPAVQAGSPGPAMMALVLVHVGVLLGLALWEALPCLRREYARLDWWEGALIWTADTAALLGFLWCTGRYWTSARRAAPGPPLSRDRVDMELLASGLATVLAVDFALTAAIAWRDDALLTNATTAVAEVHRIETFPEGHDRRLFVLHCRFSDALGTTHDVPLAIRTDSHCGFWGDDRNPLQEELRRASVPFSVNVLYAPGSPHKAWLAGVEGRSMGTLGGLSLTLIGLQAVILFPFFSFVAGLQKSGAAVSQWAYDVLCGLPLVLEAVILLVWANCQAG